MRIGRATRFATLAVLTPTNIAKGLPMKSETRSERRILQAIDGAGKLHDVLEIAHFKRFWFEEGRWSEWHRTTGEYWRGTEPVNLEEDGTMTAVASGEKLKPLAPR